MFALLLHLACVDGPPPGCGIYSGLEHDRCVADELTALTPDQLDLVRAKTSAIQDPIVRGAALDTWLKAHAKALPTQDAQGLCQLLEGPAAAACNKRVHAAHLNR
jgi:hypothetical protein